MLTGSIMTGKPALKVVEPDHTLSYRTRAERDAAAAELGDLFTVEVGVLYPDSLGYVSDGTRCFHFATDEMFDSLVAAKRPIL